MPGHYLGVTRSHEDRSCRHATADRNLERDKNKHQTSFSSSSVLLSIIDHHALNAPIVGIGFLETAAHASSGGAYPVSIYELSSALFHHRSLSPTHEGVLQK